MSTNSYTLIKRGFFAFAALSFLCSCGEISKEPSMSDSCGGAVVKIDDNLSERYLVPEYAEPGNEQFDRYRGSAPVYDFQRAAGFLGYAFTATDSHNTALFMYKPHTNYSFKQYDNLLFEREACALQLEDRKLVLHYYGYVDFDFDTRFHECFIYAFFHFSGITVDPSSFNYLVRRLGDPIPTPGEWDILLVDYDRAGVSIGFNTESPRFRCLIEASPINTSWRQRNATSP